MKSEIAALHAELDLLQTLIAMGTSGKTTTADLTLLAIQAVISKKIIQHLHAAEIQKLIVTCETFYADTDEMIPQFERKHHDSAVHAPSLHAFNGRSLDSHNPWHLHCSFEDHLAAEFEDPEAMPRTPPPAPGVDKTCKQLFFAGGLIRCNAKSMQREAALQKNKEVVTR